MGLSACWFLGLERIAFQAGGTAQERRRLNAFWDEMGLEGKGRGGMGFSIISCRELERLAGSGGDFRLIDLRDEAAYRRERLKGAVHIPFEELGDRLGELTRQGLNVFYCDRGAKSMYVCRRLCRMGYPCASLACGIVNYRGKLIDRTRL